MLNVTWFLQNTLREQMTGLFNRCPSFRYGATDGRSQEMITDLPHPIQLLIPEQDSTNNVLLIFAGIAGHSLEKNLTMQKTNHRAHK